MNTQSPTEQMLNIVRTDSDLTISGGIKLPTRNASGERSFTPGEETILLSYKEDVRENQDTINKAEDDLAKCEEERLDISQQIEKNTLKYEKQTQAAEAQFEQNKKQLEKLEQDNPNDDPKEDHPQPKQKGRKDGAKKMFSFVSIAFIAEVVTSLATINLQQETLSMDVILWRFAYILVIYVFTCILYAKYLKTGVKAVKGLLIGCFLMSLACLLHAVVLTFVNVDIATPVATDFNLNAIETVEQETSSGSLLTNFINNPGLIEFIIATLLVFAGEIITIDVKNNDATKTPETIVSQPQNFDNVDFEAVARINANRHKATLENDQKKLLHSQNQRKASLNGFCIKMDNDLADNQKRREVINASLLLAKHKKEEMLEKRYSLLAKYRELLRGDLAIRLGVDVSTIDYEPILKKDIEAYDRNNME